jgi:DNA-directed RNA polymerase subunit beta'
MPNILDYNKFCEDLKPITSVKVFKKRFFHSEGLFSEQIFGPLKNYTCQCGTYYGISKSGGQCKDCLVDIVNSNERRKRFAKIVLPIPVVNPLMYDLIVSLGGKAIKAPLDNLMKNEKSILYVIGDETFVVHDPDIIPKTATRYEKAEAIHILVKTFSEMMYEDLQDENWKKIVKNIDNFLIREIIVLPPDLRPSTQSGSKQLMDKINRYYIQILTKKEVMQASHLEAVRDKSIYYTFFRNLQKDVKELHEKILEKLAKKEGLIRGNILGKRIDFSGRAVIVPEPALSLDECVLPYKMILEIFKLQVAKRIIGLGSFKKLPTALNYINKCIKFNHLALLSVCKETVKGKVCILNRQPSLHRLGMLGFNIKVSQDSVIKVHPLVCHPFNADFDGDQMAIYVPLSEETIQEVKDKMFVTKNLISPANEQLTTLPAQDIVLGVYYLTAGRFNDDTFNGLEHFNSMLPDGFRTVTDTVDEKHLIQILDEVRINHPDQIVEILDEVKKMGFYYATLSGCTLSLDDFLMEDAKKIKKYIYDTDGDIYESLKRSSSDHVTKFLKENFKYADLIDSGARGSWDQARQLCLSRGFISNFKGEIHDKPIKNNLTDGLTQNEFFDSTYGCRKGLLDTALNTGTSGYLSRKLIFTCANLQLSDTVEDCGTTDFLEVKVTNEKKASCLINRLIENGDELKLITRENYKEIVGETVKVRSPIYCLDNKVCRTCYGESYKTLNSSFIGIIAAQTLGEKSTQLVLRTFHTSGSAIIKDSTADKKDMKQEDIIGDLSAVSTMLHKFKDTTCESLVHDLFEVYDRNVFQVHYECVVAQLMWVGMKKWRLHPDRRKYQPKFHSIQSVPDQESWLLAMAFSNPRKSILHGIINSGNYSGIMDTILRGEKV